MHRHIRLLALVSALVFTVTGLRSQTPPDESLRMPEDYFPGLKALLETAIKQSPRMVSKNAEEVIAEADQIGARAGQLPTVSGYGNYYPWTDERRKSGAEPHVVTSHGSNNRLAYNMALTQPVFHWGALHDNTKIGKIRLKMAQGSTAEAYRLLAGEIRSQYLQLVVKKVGLARARFSQRVADDALALARSKLEKHVISEAELFSPTVGAEQARLWTDRVEFDYENSKVLLGKLCGAPALTDEQIPEEIPAVSPASSAIDRIVASYSAKGEPDTYYFRNLRYGIEVERLNYHMATTRLKPKVNAILGASQDEQVFALADAPTSKYQVNSVYAGIGVNWTVFDGFATRSAKIASNARRRELERVYKEQTADFLVALQNQKRQLEFSTRNVAISEKILDGATNNVRTAEDDLKRGLTSETGVNNARLNYYATRIDTFAARNEYLLRVADLLSTTMQDPALANLPGNLR